jgi:hypothetical protein
MSDHEEQLAEPGARGERRGFDAIYHRTRGYIVARRRRQTNPHTDSHATLHHPREMLDGIEWEHGTIKPGWA